VPEIPDIEVFSYNLGEKFAGKKMVKVVVVNGKKLKDTPEEISEALEGQTIEDIYRSGKEFWFKFSNGTILGKLFRRVKI
jgi:formamidopyrimidine-DNA glycosylase